MEKGHYGQYTGNARHSRTPVTRGNYSQSEIDTYNKGQATGMTPYVNRY